MRILLALIMIAMISLPLGANAYDVLVLLSQHDQVYEEALKGFRKARNFSERVIVLSDYADVDIPRKVREDRPRLILAVGDRALTEAKKIRQVPTVSLMALSYQRLAGSYPAITGVRLQVDQEQYLALIVSMNLKRIGVIADPGKSAGYLHKAERIAGEFGIGLIPQTVRSPKEVTGKLAAMKGLQVDAIWMIPDSTAVNIQSLEGYFLFSMGQNVPIISFDRSHLHLGAAAVIEADRIDMGMLAGEMAAAILDGKPVSDLPPAMPRKLRLKINRRMLNRLGIATEGIEKMPYFQEE